jgi:hypothetical protein
MRANIVKRLSRKRKSQGCEKFVQQQKGISQGHKETYSIFLDITDNLKINNRATIVWEEHYAVEMSGMY